MNQNLGILAGICFGLSIGLAFAWADKIRNEHQQPKQYGTYQR